MDPTNLTQFYDTLKGNLPNDNHEHDMSSPVVKITRVRNQSLDQSPRAMMWRNKAVHHCHDLKDKCRKHIILDIYCNILPLDQDYIDRNMGKMRSDVDSMLSTKDMTPSQYLTSCYEATHAPLLEFLIRSTDYIGQQYMEEADEKLKDAQENDTPLEEPATPDTDDPAVDGQLVDIKQDTEYQTFIDKLKQKTINKIVSDVSKIINDKKQEKEMTFDPKPVSDQVLAAESAVSIGVNYLQNKLWKDNIVFTESMQDEMIGMAIREATLNQLDIVFRQPRSSLKDFESKIRFGKGAIINESAVTYFREEANISE